MVSVGRFWWMQRVTNGHSFRAGEDPSFCNILDRISLCLGFMGIQAVFTKTLKCIQQKNKTKQKYPFSIKIPHPHSTVLFRQLATV